MASLLNKRNVIFLLAITLGLALPQAAAWTRHLMMPALALVMTLSTIGVPNSYFFRPRAIIRPSLIGIMMTYAILGSVILILSSLLIGNEDLQTGFVLVAAVPPAVAVIPFTAMLDGDVSYTLSGTVASYLAALVLMPLIMWLFIKTGFDDPYKLLIIISLLIVAPLAVSRLILYFKWQDRLEPVRGWLTDLAFFIVLYSMVGVNRDLIFSRPIMLAPVAGVVFAATFVLGWAIRKTVTLLKMERKKIVSLVLQGTLKNQGIAGGLAIALFEKEAAIPSAVYTVFMILYIVWLGWRERA
ncbi:MAG: hypothetical protein JW807_17245 [Spirochaetes bacterium]|nr:hypothetical protein [Spirochaetota bacterium]